MQIDRVLRLLGYVAMWDMSGKKVRLVIHGAGLPLFAGTVDDVWRWLKVTNQFTRTEQ